jgi:transposase InsO family protein
MLKRRQAQDAVMQEVLQDVLAERRKHPRMGVRKLLHKLKSSWLARGIRIGRDRLFALLRRHGMLVKRKRKGSRTTFPGGIRSENLLEDREITAPDQAYVADITYLETDQGFRYLALVTDLYSRKIVGWDLSDSLSLEGALRAMRQAVRQRRHSLSGLIHHSDHGVQYASHDYLDLLTHHGIRSSMGRVGNAYDNAVAERVNGILKLEYLLDHRFPDTQTARKAVEQAIHLYNTDRPHLSLKYRTPEQVYRQATRGGQGSHSGAACASAGAVKGRRVPTGCSP